MSSQQGGRPRQQTSQSDGVRHALFGIAVYGVFIFGSFVYHVLKNTLVSDKSYYFDAVDENTLFASLQFPFVRGSSVIGLLIAFGIGVYYYANTGPRESSFQPAAIATAAGAASVLIPTLVLLSVTAPDRIDLSIGDEIVGVLVAVLTFTLTAVLAAVALDRQTPT